MSRKEKYAKIFYDLVKETGEYECHSEYQGVNNKVLMFHKVCGNTYWQQPQKFKIGRRCHHCSTSKPLTKEIIQQRLDEKFPNKFTILSDYKNSTTKMTVRNNNCGHVYKIKQQDLLSGKDCFECFGSKRYSQEEFIEIFKERGISGYTVVGEYINLNTKIDICHDECGTIFSIHPASYFNQLKKCPNCNIKSLGEHTTKEVLEDLGIEFEREKRFEGCRHVHTLPFDFYLPKYNICIEYQGIQHYQPVKQFGGQENLEYTLKMDGIKKDFCNKEGIKLIEIPYWIKTTQDIKKLLVEKIC